jgi:DNA-binding GntR family transcriptional regulator
MINKKNFSEQIYESLKQDIIDQKIGFGEKLVNRELQVKFGVSSTPVRDAINRLYQDGLVEDISKSGARVITFDYKEALEINEIVSILNVTAVKLSAEKNDIKQIVPFLEQCINQQQENIDNAKFFDYDCSFHNTFFDFSGNAHYKKLYARYHVLWKILVRLYYLGKETTRVHAIAQHKQILDVYSRGEIQLAQDYMEQHFLEAAHTLMKMLTSDDKYKSGQLF